MSAKFCDGIADNLPQYSLCRCILCIYIFGLSLISSQRISKEYSLQGTLYTVYREIVTARLLGIFFKYLRGLAVSDLGTMLSSEGSNTR